MIDKIRYWSYKILPLSYDDSLSYSEILYKVTHKVNEIINTINDNLKTIIRERLNELFLETVYEEETETIIIRVVNNDE